MIDQVLLEKAYQQAKDVRLKAYAPYSTFLVGASVITASKAIYSGCNVENVSFGATICAERNALFQWVSQRPSGDDKILGLVLVTDTENPIITPCGMCLQVMAEFLREDTPVYICNLKGMAQPLAFRELFPKSFTKFTV